MIELLVVISIIALLIGILLPALGAARGTARSLKCKSTLRQFALGYQMYTNDFKGWTVPIADGTQASGVGTVPDTTFWVENASFAGYVAKDDVSFNTGWDAGWICPDAEGAMVGLGGASGQTRLGWAYGINNEMFGTFFGDQSYVETSSGNKRVLGSYPIDDIQSPTQVMSMADAGEFNIDGVAQIGNWQGEDVEFMRTEPRGPGSNAGPAPRHNTDVPSNKAGPYYTASNPITGNLNATFFDGHAAGMSFDDLVDGDLWAISPKWDAVNFTHNNEPAPWQKNHSPR